MFLKPSSTDEHVHSVLEEMHSVLENVRKHQLQISNAQCATMERLLKAIRKVVKKQSKVLKEVMIGNRTRQLHYEGTLTAIAEQQRHILEALAKFTDDNAFVQLQPVSNFKENFMNA